MLDARVGHKVVCCVRWHCVEVPAYIAIGDSVTEKSRTQRNQLQREQQEAHSPHRVAIETTSIAAMHATKAWPRAPRAQCHLGRGPAAPRDSRVDCCHDPGQMGTPASAGGVRFARAHHAQPLHVVVDGVVWKRCSRRGCCASAHLQAVLVIACASMPLLHQLHVALLPVPASATSSWRRCKHVVRSMLPMMSASLHSNAVKKSLCTTCSYKAAPRSQIASLRHNAELSFLSLCVSTCWTWPRAPPCCIAYAKCSQSSASRSCKCSVRVSPPSPGLKLVKAFYAFAHPAPSTCYAAACPLARVGRQVDLRCVPPLILHRCNSCYGCTLLFAHLSKVVCAIAARSRALRHLGGLAKFAVHIFKRGQCAYVSTAQDPACVAARPCILDAHHGSTRGHRWSMHAVVDRLRLENV